MITNGNAHVFGMNRIAAGDETRSRLDSLRTSKPKRITLALRYGTSDDECKWVLAYPTKGVSPEVGTFSTKGLSPEEVSKKVAFMGLEKIINSSLDHVDLYMSQKGLRQNVADVREHIPTVEIAKLDDPLGVSLDHQAQSIIGWWQRHGNDESGRTTKARQRRTSARLEPERTVYMTTSMNRAKRLYGIGYVVRDIYTYDEAEEQVWNLRFYSSTSTLTTRGDDVVATLLAMVRVLSGRNTLSKNVRDQTRSLVIYSPDKAAVETLNVMLSGERMGDEAREIWRDPAARVIQMLKGIKSVRFEVDEGGSAPLHEAAERLALAARRNEEFAIDREARIEIKMQIVQDTLEALEESGVAATFGEVTTDNADTSGSLPLPDFPSESK